VWERGGAASFPEDWERCPKNYGRDAALNFKITLKISSIYITEHQK
jgi:hypothetical protein